MTRCPLISECSFFDAEASDHQRIHAGTEKGLYRVGRGVHDRFTAQIEGRIHDDRYARAFSEFIDQSPVQRVDFSLHGLWSSASIHMRDRRNYASFFPRVLAPSKS